jgi:hypothetical protein
MDGHSRSGARPERYRLFIAIALPEPVRHAIEKAQEGLRAALPAKSIRWTRTDQFHLTLRFLSGRPSTSRCKDWRLSWPATPARRLEGR